MNKRTTPSVRCQHAPGRYALRKGLGCWELTFAGRRALLKHEQGIFYVAYLLANPPQQPLHGLALALRAKAADRCASACVELLDPETGEPMTLGNDTTFQQRGLSLDNAEALLSLRRKQHELEALLDDRLQIEPVKEEIRRELEEIYAHQKKNLPRVRGTAQKAVRAVRAAIVRLHARLVESTNSHGNPDPVLRGFAKHINNHILRPSARFASAPVWRARQELAGCFTYEPPPGVTWTC